MGKAIPDDVMNLPLDDIADHGNRLDLCSAQPANYAGIAAVSLAHATLITGDLGGDYTIGDSLLGGRKLVLDSRSIVGTGDGTALFAVISDTVNVKIKAITTCNIPVETDGTIPLNSYDVWDIRDPV